MGSVYDHRAVSEFLDSLLVFITEEKWGRKYLDTPMIREYINHLQGGKLKIVISYVNF